MPAPGLKSVEWKVHLTSPPEDVYQAISTETGRESFWAESAPAVAEVIHFEFPNGVEMRSAILEARPPETFAVDYFGGTATFDLASDGDGGTDLTLHHEGLSETEYHDTAAGWVSVLLSLKAAVDFGIDVRNHDPQRTWDEGYVDN